MTFDGKWRITAMDLWDQKSLDLVVPAYLQFDAGGLGEFQFIAVQVHAPPDPDRSIRRIVTAESAAS